jgi:hypothetical protein
LALHSPIQEFLRDWQYPHSASGLVNDEQCTGYQFGFILAECGDNNRGYLNGQNIFSPNLNYTGTPRMSQREHRSKVQIVRENDMIIGQGPNP